MSRYAFDINKPGTYSVRADGTYVDPDGHECQATPIADDRCGCGNRHGQGRACTPEAKRLAVARLLAAWERCPQARLGQLLVNASGSADLSYVEDDALLGRMGA